MNSIIGKGRTAIVYQYGDSCALKLFNKGFEKMAEKEFKKTLILHRTGLPCPKVFKLLEQDGKKGIVYQFVKGESLFYHLKQCPFMVKKYAREMAQMHNKIHCYCGSELEEICIQLANRLEMHLTFPYQTKNKLLNIWIVCRMEIRCATWIIILIILCLNKEKFLP